MFQKSLHIQIDLRLFFAFIATFSLIGANQAQKSDENFKSDKNWSYISGAQRAINDSNRVHYLCQIYPTGVRVSNFDQMELLDFHDSQFVQFHLNANQVYRKENNFTGPSFFISKHEVSNKEYRDFVDDCIQKIMEKQRPDIVKNFKFQSVEYINAFAEWLISDDSISAKKWANSKSTITTWMDFWLLKLNNRKITFKGVSIFPNTNAWISDFSMTYNEPMGDYYFIHKAYNNYPVVCVSQIQASKYCEWYTENQEIISKSKVVPPNMIYRLPTEQEWERAASVLAEKPIKKSSGSPVKNNYLRNAEGIYIANFRPANHDFMVDGFLYSAPVESYLPNDAGCYNMQGNVAEWTTTKESVKNVKPLVASSSIPIKVKAYWIHIMQLPSIEGYIVKGGAWNFPEAACTVGSRTIIPQNEERSFVGFRMICIRKQMRFIGTPEF